MRIVDVLNTSVLLPTLPSLNTVVAVRCEEIYERISCELEGQWAALSGISTIDLVALWAFRLAIRNF